jgi:hypothetical protein
MQKNDTRKVVFPPGDISGKATAPAFTQVMNLLINILTKFGLLKKDLDYHLVRASMIIIYFFFGYQKWFAYEGAGIGSFYPQRPSYFMDVPCFRHPGGQLVSGDFGMVIWRALALRFLE